MKPLSPPPLRLSRLPRRAHLAACVFAAPISLLPLGDLAAQDVSAEESVQKKEKMPADKELVRRAVLDYVLSAYKVEPQRVERSVDKKLVKVGYLKREGEEKYTARPMTFEQLKKLVSEWNADGHIPKDAPQKIEVLDVVDQIACAKLTAAWGIDYMQLHKPGKRWLIRHVVWQRSPADGFQPSEKDLAAIRAAALDYVQGIYQAKPERIDKSVAKTLAKFGYYRPARAMKGMPMPMTFGQLRGLAANLHKDSGPPKNAPEDITVLDALDQTAAVKLVGAWGIDYMHFAKLDGTWKAIHVMWQSHPVKKSKVIVPAKSGK